MLARKALVQNTRIHKQAGSLVRHGYDVTVIGPAVASRPARQNVGGVSVVRVGGIRTRRLGAALRYLDYALGVLRLTRSLTPPQIVHCNDLDTLPLGLLIARRFGAAVVYDVQDLYPDQDHIPRRLRRLLSVCERLLIKRADRVFAVNELIGEVLHERYSVNVDAVVLNCPPFVEQASATGRATLRETLDIPVSQKVVVYSGAFSPYRGLEATILALRELPDVSLVLLGGGPLRGQLERLGAREGVGDRLHFTGFVDHADVPAFISTADVGIVPYEHVGLNHYLCSPSKLFHYLMAELPVACSDFPFLRRVVLDNQLGAVFDPADPQSIAAALRELLSRQQAGNGDRDRLRSLKRRYSWEREEERFLAAYRSLGPSRGAPRPRWSRPRTVA
jgi:glycosyltransferase involved in cell wall biosynthesis